MLRVPHRCCHDAVGEWLKLTLRVRRLCALTPGPCMFIILAFVPSYAIVFRSPEDWGFQGEGVEGMYPFQAGTLEYTTGAHHVISAGFEGLTDRGKEGKRRDRQQENCLGFPSCNNFSDGVVQGSICSLSLHSLTCYPSKTIGTAEKTFSGDHTDPLCSWLVTHTCPNPLDQLFYLSSVTVSRRTVSNMHTQFTVTLQVFSCREDGEGGDVLTWLQMLRMFK